MRRVSIAFPFTATTGVNDYSIFSADGALATMLIHGFSVALSITATTGSPTCTVNVNGNVQRQGESGVHYYTIQSVRWGAIAVGDSFYTYGSRSLPNEVFGPDTVILRLNTAGGTITGVATVMFLVGTSKLRTRSQTFSAPTGAITRVYAEDVFPRASVASFAANGYRSHVTVVAGASVSATGRIFQEITQIGGTAVRRYLSTQLAAGFGPTTTSSFVLAPDTAGPADKLGFEIDASGEAPGSTYTIGWSLAFTEAA